LHSKGGRSDRLDLPESTNMIFADRTLAQQLERAEASANASFVDTRARLQPQSGARRIEVAGAYAMFDGAGSPLTQTFGLGLFDTVGPAELDALEAFFTAHEAPVCHETSPMADAALWPLLAERGYRPIEFTSVLYRPLIDNQQLELKLNPAIRTRSIMPSEVDAWAATAARGWSTEGEAFADFILDFGRITAQSTGTVAFVAEAAEQPISAGVLHLHNGVALLAGASTVPEGRRQGAQLALLDARLRYAAEHGAQVAMMGALPGSQSQRNAEKHGFRIAYTRIKWQLLERP
jgi:hypothetical protein